MTANDIAEPPLHHEGRPSKAPTAARILDLYADAARHHLTTHDGTIVQTFEPQLDDLQRHILELLDIPPSPYLSAPTDPLPAGTPYAGWGKIRHREVERELNDSPRNNHYGDRGAGAAGGYGHGLPVGSSTRCRGRG